MGLGIRQSRSRDRGAGARDVEETMRAAAAVGDDNIQRQTQGTVVPESFTHGSSAQRMRWFQAGFKGGRLQDCDTFAAR